MRVANGGAYFADNMGVIRKLTVNGAITQVATFPLTKPNQGLSYAVSPDGSKLIAIVFSTPPLHDPPPRTLGDPLFDPGSWSIDLETAAPSEAASLVLHKDLGTALPPAPTVVTGWDNAGPTATLGSAICTQNVIPSPYYTGTLIHLGLDGTHLDRIGGLTCNAWDELIDGTVLCGGADWQSFSVRTTKGDVLWSRTTNNVLGEVRLSPDGNAVATGDGTIYTRYNDQPASFARTTGGVSARVIGWAGPANAVAVRYDGRLGLLGTSDPIGFMDLGLTLSIPCPGCAPVGVVIGTLVA